MIYSYYDLLNHLCRCCVANLTHMLQTSSFNQTHVLVASNSISLFCLEGRIYIITLLNPLPVLLILLNPLPVLIVLLNPLPVLIVLKILREVLLFTRSFMINICPLVGCLENSDGKVNNSDLCYTVDCLKSSCLLFVDTK